MGIWNVPAMMSEMSSRLLSEWIAYYELEPFGAEVFDLHMSELRAIEMNAHRAKNASVVNGEKLRFWKKLEQFDPKSYYDQLKASLTFKKADKD